MHSEQIEGIAVFHPRRFSDPVSDLNADMHDRARLLAQTVEMIDRLGIVIYSVEADRSRNSRVHVAYSRECDALGAIEYKRANGWSHWIANRFGVEIVWRIRMEAA